MSTTESDLAALIPSWLAVTRDRQIATALSREEALRRASVLRCLLRDGKVQAQEVALNEDLKDVFHALVTLVTELEPLEGAAFAEEANTVYQFAARVEWLADDFHEKRDLLALLAEAGWQALGYSVTRLATLRTSCRQTTRPDAASWVPLDARWLASHPGAALKACRAMREAHETFPAEVNRKATKLYQSLSEHRGRFGLFDELDFYMGQVAYEVGSTYRPLGNRVAAEFWLERAECHFQKCVTAEHNLASVAYSRLALEYDRGRCSRVLEKVPSLIATCGRLGLTRELGKALFLEAMSLKKTGKDDDARRQLYYLAEHPSLKLDAVLQGLVFINLAEFLSMEGRYEDAMPLLGQGLESLRSANCRWGIGEVKLIVGATFERQGMLDKAIEAYRDALSTYTGVGMVTFGAYVRLVISEALLRANLIQEAEREILQALPTIEEQKMVPEGFAAVALLRESVRRQNTDPEALRQLREHLQRRHGS